ncbi:MAG: DUF2336 domain-containing protein [Pseudorhodoplanes sp.]
MPSAAALIPELEQAVQSGTPERRSNMARQIATLFLQGSPKFSEEQIHVFDDVLVRLVNEIEVRARAELARRLAPIGNAPQEVIRRLAKDDDIAVSGPVLSQSQRLGEADLIDIASRKGQSHLVAISGRSHIQEALTDILIARGDHDVVRLVAGNPGARLSDSGYSSLVRRAERDGILAETVIRREDMPDDLFRELVTRATEVVQKRLLATAKPETQSEIRRVLADVSTAVVEVAVRSHDFSDAQAQAARLRIGGGLNESAIAESAAAGRYEEAVATLAALTEVPLGVVDRLMKSERPDPVLILCKAFGFAWTTAKALILLRPGAAGKTNAGLEHAAGNFDRLSASTAQRVVRFWQSGAPGAGPVAVVR